jgi:malic enzyme
MSRAFFMPFGKRCHVFLPVILAKDVANTLRQEVTLLSTLRALSACSPVRQSASASLYPRVAVAVVLAAQSAGVAEQTSPEELERRVAAQMWKPHYPRLRYKADI